MVMVARGGIEPPKGFGDIPLIETANQYPSDDETTVTGIVSNSDPQSIYGGLATTPL
jgi:hypothetical protein